MHKLICTKFTHYDDFYKNENYKKYREQGIDNCTVPCEEWMNEKVEPATKEQRNTLLKAMDGAGYIFDFENKELKELKKIEDVKKYMKGE